MDRRRLFNELYSMSFCDIWIVVQDNHLLDLGDYILSDIQKEKGVVLHITNKNAKNIEVTYENIICDMSFNNKMRRCIIPLDSIIAMYTNEFLIQLPFKITDNQSQKVNGHLRLV